MWCSNLYLITDYSSLLLFLYLKSLFSTIYFLCWKTFNHSHKSPIQVPELWPHSYVPSWVVAIHDQSNHPQMHSLLELWLNCYVLSWVVAIHDWLNHPQSTHWLLVGWHKFASASWSITNGICILSLSVNHSFITIVDHLFPTICYVLFTTSD
jgi:hypothetical protein